MIGLLQKYWIVSQACCMVLMLMICWLVGIGYAQNDEHTSQRIIADSVVIIPEKGDSLGRNSKYRFDANHQPRPVHPYFRDSYRIIQDMRRLVRMFNFSAVEGYESMDDLVDVCRHLPERQQNRLIGMAMAGGAANLLAERTNRELRRRNMDFLQWQVDKVTFRNRFKFISLSLHAGVNSRGFVLSIPAGRIYLYRYFADYYITEGLIVMPTRHLGINCHRYDGRSLIAPFYVTKLGSYEWTYDWKRKILTSKVDLRKTSRLVIRLVHVNFFNHRYPDRMLGEVIIWR